MSVARAGRVRAQERLWVDDTGPFLPCGFSWFTAIHAWEHERDRLLKNAEFMSGLGCFDHYRAFYEVSGASWEDRTLDPMRPGHLDQAAQCVDALYDRFGLRCLLTVFAGRRYDIVSPVIDQVVNLVRGREHKFLYVEGANESWQNFPDLGLLRRAVRHLSDETHVMTAVSAPGGTYASWENEPGRAYDMARGVADLLPFHTDRRDDTAERKWRQVRQAWDMRDLSLWAKSHQEPPGLESSVATAGSPLQITMLRAMGTLCGLGAFVLHTGAGVRFGGAADLTPKPYAPGGRRSNFYDYGDTVKQIAQGFTTVSKIVPPDIVNWAKANGNWPDHPLPADYVWMDGLSGDGHGVVRTYAAYDGGSFYTMPVGVRYRARLVARRNCQIEVLDPMTGSTVDSRVLNAGDAYTIAGRDDWDAAYIVRGKFL